MTTDPGEIREVSSQLRGLLRIGYIQTAEEAETNLFALEQFEKGERFQHSHIPHNLLNVYRRHLKKLETDLAKAKLIMSRLDR